MSGLLQTFSECIILSGGARLGSGIVGPGTHEGLTGIGLHLGPILLFHLLVCRSSVRSTNTFLNIIKENKYTFLNII